MKKLVAKVSLLIPSLMLLFFDVSSAIQKPIRIEVLSNLSIDIIRVSIILVIAIVMALLILKLKNKLSFSIIVGSMVLIALIVLGCIVGVNKQSKEVFLWQSFGDPSPRSVMTRIFDFSQW